NCSEALPELHSDGRIALDVTHVAGVVAVFGHNPERVTSDAVADRRASRLTRMATGGLEEGPTEGQQADAEQNTDWGVDEIALEGADDPAHGLQAGAGQDHV